MTQGNVRMSGPTLKVLRQLLAAPREPRSGADIARVTKIGSGTLYPLLARLEAAGWLKSEWEEVAPEVAGRPRRRFYTLTGVGQTEANKALEELQFTPGRLAWIG